MAVEYHLVTRLRVDRPPGRVWQTLIEVGDWSKWWKWLREVELLAEGDEDGLGSRFRQRVSSPLLYGFDWETQITRVEKPSVIELDSFGDLHGRGQFLLKPVEEGTELVFTWLVVTRKWWMNVVAPLARPLFVWSHDRLMTDFATGIAPVIGGRLLEVSHSTLRPSEPGFNRFPDESEKDDRRRSHHEGVDREGT